MQFVDRLVYEIIIPFGPAFLWEPMSMEFSFVGWEKSASPFSMSLVRSIEKGEADERFISSG